MAVPPQFSQEQAYILKNSGVVVTGRFHGACFAILAGRPFLAVSSDTNKIKGVLAGADLGEGAVFLEDSTLFDNPTSILDSCVERLNQLSADARFLAEYQPKCLAFVEMARHHIEKLFIDVKGIV